MRYGSIGENDFASNSGVSLLAGQRMEAPATAVPALRALPRHASHIAFVIGSALAALIAIPSTSPAIVVGGGGSVRTDCLGVFDAPANSPIARPRNVRCQDGAACDEDGVVNGVCQISVGYCANSTQVPGCSAQGVIEITVAHALDDGIDPDFDPQFQALQTRIDGDIDLPTADADVCATPATFRVAVRGPLGRNRCRSGRTKIAVTTLSMNDDGRVVRDRDSLRLECLPANDANGCEPQTFFTSTFARVQQQIFTPTCATAACHDSQTIAANLLLDTGASRANLIDVLPTNGAAFAAGWRRIALVNPTTGDLETSFVYRKVTGDLPSASYGLRMPRKRPKLHRTLQDILRVWIEHGAPDESAGWLPGTY